MKLHIDQIIVVAMSFASEVLLPATPKGLQRLLLGGAIAVTLNPTVTAWIENEKNLSMLKSSGIMDANDLIDLEKAEKFLQKGMEANGGRLTEAGYTFDDEDIIKLMAIARAAAEKNA